MIRKIVLLGVVASLAVMAWTVQAQDDMDMMGPTLFASLNPGELADDAVVSINSDLTETTTTLEGFEDIASIQSVKFTSDGTAYVTVDVAEGQGGVLVVDGMEMTVGEGSRIIAGAEQAGLISPKGLEIIEALDLVLVANFGASNIKGFPLDAEGDAAATVFIDDLAGVGGSVWDVHYDAETDQLFAAGTTGTLFIYGNFSNDLGVNGPTQTIVPSDDMGAQISINLHGVDYDAASDTVLLSDVGAADDATDGQLFVISGVSEASGNVSVDVAIGGPDTQLGNPVDIVFDGSDLFVAEKANDALFVYGDILNMSGMLGDAATITLDITKPESVTLTGEEDMMDMGMEATEEAMMDDMEMTEEPMMDDMEATEEAMDDMGMEATEEATEEAGS